MEFRVVLGITIFFLCISIIVPAFGNESLYVSRDEVKKAVAEKLAREISENWNSTLEGKFENLKGCSTYVPENWKHKTHFFYIDRLPPSFNVGFHKGEFPLMINSHEISYLKFAEKTEHVKLSVKEPLQIAIRVFEDSGPENVQTFSLAINHQGTDLVGNPPKTYIIWDSKLIYDQIPKNKGIKDIIETFQVSDPEELFSDVMVTSLKNGHKLELIFDINFERPMKKSNIIFYTSDRIGNPMICNIVGILEIVDNSQDVSNNFNESYLDIKCKKPLIPATKVSNGVMVCLKPQTAKILFERNWAILENN